MTTDAPVRLIVAMALAQFGAYLAILTPVVVTLSVRVAQIAPDDKASALSAVLSVGAILAILGNPFFGAMSDRTTSRFGRRRPWLLGGILVTFGGLTVVAGATGIGMLTVGWAVSQLGFNATLAALTALLPDQIPPHQRGRVGGLLGLMTAVAVVGGAGLATALSGQTMAMFLVPAALGIAGVVVLVVVVDDRAAEPGQHPPYRLRAFLRTFYVDPRRFPDFSWNLLSRFLIYCGLTTLTTYQAYVLIDRFGYTTETVAGGVLIAGATATGSLIAGAAAGGWLSDRTGRRRPFVLASGVVVAAGLGLVAVAATFPVFLVAALLFGIGQGVYLAVDLALATEVLPNPDDAAKDMGVLNIANALPQSLVPVVAAPILAIGAGGSNYGALFVAGAAVALIGSLLVRFIRNAR
jgi:MFS family permease